MLTTSLDVTPLSEHVGVELHGLALEDVAADQGFVDAFRALVGRHRLVLMRRQTISPGTLTALVARFGPLLDIRRQGGDAVHVPGHDLIKVISNGFAPDGRPLGDGNSSAQIWHTDATPWEAPPGHIAMYCRVTPDPPPRTSFLDMIKTYASLPEAMKERINPLRVIHHQYPRQIEVEIARTGASLPLEERRRGQVHPLVRRHMATSEPILYLPTRRDSIVVGWSPEDSQELLEELWTHVDVSPFRVTHALEPDDLVLWDNAAMVHSRDGWPESQTRVVWHVSAEGEIPTPRFGARVINVIGLSDEERRAFVAATYSEY